MRSSKFREITLVLAALIIMMDIFLFSNYSEKASPEIGWWKIGAAAFIQILVFTSMVIWEVIRKRWGPLFHSQESPHSYRNYVPVVLIGIVLVGLSLSISLLHIGIVCPHEGLPTVRGQGECVLRKN
jgi:uncharacterized membrane protein